MLEDNMDVLEGTFVFFRGAEYSSQSADGTKCLGVNKLSEQTL